MDALYIGIKEFPTERVILITPEDRIDDAKKAQEELKKFKIPVQITETKGNVWEEMFQKIAEIKAIEKDKDIIINTATGDRVSTCAATSAASLFWLARPGFPRRAGLAPARPSAGHSYLLQPAKGSIYL